MEDLTVLTVAELKKKAKLLEIPRYSTLKKDKLIEAIKEKYELHKKYSHPHRGKRNLNLIKQENVENLIECMEYPFEYIRNGEYFLEVSEIPGQPEEDIGKFPDNIEEYYWISEGEGDENPWMTLCKLDNGVYVFYKGECDYTGFDCQGSMEIYASRDPSVLIHQAMSNSDYDVYSKDVTNNF